MDEGTPGEIPDKLFFRIGEVAQIVGVEPHVLRYWEGEFRMRPTRSQAGQRMYRQKDVARFLRIKSLLHDQGFTIAGARKALSDAAGGGAPSAPGGPVAPREADAARGHEALEKLAAIRGQIAALREKVRAAAFHR
jgi:DNA-binding transcriptional MerR regulator